jgi:hypothetical protein
MPGCPFWSRQHFEAIASPRGHQVIIAGDESNRIYKRRVWVVSIAWVQAKSPHTQDYYWTIGTILPGLCYNPRFAAFFCKCKVSSGDVVDTMFLRGTSIGELFSFFDTFIEDFTIEVRYREKVFIFSSILYKFDVWHILI